MESDRPSRRESVPLKPLANSPENVGSDTLESMEEGRLPDNDSSPTEAGDSRSEAGPEPLSTWRILRPAQRARRFCREHKQLIRWICIGLLCTGYAVFLLVACIRNFQRALGLFVLTCVVLAFLAYRLLKRLLAPKLRRHKNPHGHPCLNLCAKRGLALAALLFLVLWLSLDTSRRPEQLVSFAGMCVFIAVLFACSKHHHAVSWRTVSWGLVLQFALGLFVIRTEPGFVAFQWLGDQIQIFLSYTRAGSTFVFGNNLVDDVFAFKTETPLLIRPYLADMTLSEIHVILTAGFSTIAGSLLGAYISFGIDAASLVAASVMAAPCALALSKLVYPEVEKSKFKSEEGVKLTYGDAQNLIEAVSSGATISVKLVSNIIANLIAYLALLAFINSVLSWLGNMVDVDRLSFQLICSYILRPVAFLMGVAWEDCPVVAELLGIKLFVNEFVAYQELSKYKQHRLAGAEEWAGTRKQWISVRAEILTTFALCGFANFSSIGIVLGSLTSMVPLRRSDISRIVLRALFTGTCVTLVNACVAGILYVPRVAQVDCTSLLNTTLSSSSFEVYQCCFEFFQSDGLEFGPKALSNCCQFYNRTVCA
ncbi:sodium/nucleoside cotransporter 1-like isoform X4 [Microcebus murinus]|uniref:sodium/nucleoside cotransporter 1-like isoform X4 n=1 Tax=Microcebus murinus TaxID=30608 RepID=UPI003F6B586E